MSALKDLVSQSKYHVVDTTVQAMLPLAKMASEREKLRAEYTGATPYPYVMFDNWFDPALLDEIAATFPSREKRDWIAYDTVNELKQTSRGIAGLSPIAQMFFLQLSSEPFLQFLRDVTGFSDLVADPMFHGGGLHELFKGGWLNLHADWTKHPTLPLIRRLNLIIYLNRDWDTSWGGALELWGPGAKSAGASVPPLFNRAVLFPTTSETLHGFPQPITCPDNRSRKSISMFYWSPDTEQLGTGSYINFLPGKKRTQAVALIRMLTPPAVFVVKDWLVKTIKGVGPHA